MRQAVFPVSILCLAAISAAPGQDSAQQSSRPPSSIEAVLSRASEEASVFEVSMLKSLSQETLEQRAWMPASRFQPRIGQKAATIPPPRLVTRVIVSEYSVGRLKESKSQDLVEFRQVISVDGVAVQSQSKARHALSLGLSSDDDRARKRMLEDFASHGLVDIASDYGLMLLAFTSRGLQNMGFREEADRQVGNETARSIAWWQTSPTSGELQFHGRRFSRLPLSGRLLVRKTDLCPLQIEVWAESLEDKQKIRDEATIGYQMSDRGFLAPTWIVHKHLVNGNVTAENRYKYEPFRVFGADAEIKFTETPDLPPPPKKK